MYLSDWKIIYGPKYNPETKKFERQVESRAAVDNCEELLDLIEKAFVNGREFTVEVDNWQPGDEDLCGEPPLTANEMHSMAWKEHQEAHR